MVSNFNNKYKYILVDIQELSWICIYPSLLCKNLNSFNFDESNREGYICFEVLNGVAKVAHLFKDKEGVC